MWIKKLGSHLDFYSYVVHQLASFLIYVYYTDASKDYNTPLFITHLCHMPNKWKKLPKQYVTRLVKRGLTRLI